MDRPPNDRPKPAGNRSTLLLFGGAIALVMLFLFAAAGEKFAAVRKSTPIHANSPRRRNSDQEPSRIRARPSAATVKMIG
jgi:hypothetical protein